MKKTTPKAEEMLSELMSILVPSEYLLNFELSGVSNKPDCWEIELRESITQVPEVLKDKDVVLDGFCNPITIMSHCFSLKKVFLVIYRRRWKERGSTEHFSNTYGFTPGGAKITKEMAAFLKDRD